ncbi:MAG: excinuclease ABC subunit UvrC [Deltaproteobacteria bacterium]|nr:MAG: excinuclease ABC subunit UvrC [Deltaproteobacteria bacterium]
MPVDPSVFDSLPEKPGVYIFRDSRGRALYVGKAKNLRNRVRSYLRPGSDGRERIPRMVEEAVDLEWVITESENEALLLENNLIKKHRPPYNVYYRDDKDYLCIRVDLKKDFPRLELVRKVKRDGALYIGPFSSAKKVRNLLNLTGKLFPLRTCTDKSFRTRNRPCTQYQIKRCLAPCVGYVGKEEYGKILRDAVDFLQGDLKRVVRELEREMKRASRELKFEDAARLRDTIRVVESVRERQSVVSALLPDGDYFGVYREGERGAVSVLYLRRSRVIDARSFLIHAGEASDEEVVLSVIAQYYTEDSYIPDEVVVPLPLPEALLLEEAPHLRDRRVSVKHPIRGKRKDLLRLAGENAREYFRARRRREVEYEDLMNLMHARLRLSRLPFRVECFDISHHGGRSPVGAMVVFEGGIPVKNQYRKFRIRTVRGVDDYAMMAEVVARRVERGEEFGPLPDVFLLDGGKGHISAVSRVLKERGIKVDIVAIAKERDGAGGDRIYIPGRKNPLSLPSGDPVLNYLMRIRDEAHRFAVTFQRKSEGREAVSSLLDGFPGIGPKRKEAIFRSYSSLSDLAREDPSRLARLLRIPVTRAEDLIDYVSAHREE